MALAQMVIGLHEQLELMRQEQFKFKLLPELILGPSGLDQFILLSP